MINKIITFLGIIIILLNIIIILLFSEKNNIYE